MEILLQLLVYLAFILIFFSGIKKEESLSEYECYKRLNSMRGIMALEIVIGHVVRYENSYLMPLGKFMLIGVSFFFFVSGWGLCKSYHEKKGYLDTFLRMRFGYLCGVAVITLMITTLIDLVCPIDTRYSINSFRFSDLVYKLIDNINWYIRALLLLYLVFFVIYRFVKKYQIISLGVTVVLIACIMYGNGFERCWYASIIGFPMGFVFYKYYAKIITFLRTVKGVLCICGLGILGLSSLFINEELFLPIFIANNSLGICVVMILVRFSLTFSVENKMKLFLNKYATELYLYQFILLAIAESAQWNYWYRMIFVISMNVIISMLVHPIMGVWKHFCNVKR